MEKLFSVKNFINLCNELIETKLLFVDKKIEAILEAIATSPEIYELLSECVNQFNKDKEFEKAFTKDSNGNKVFIMPKEEYKILALVFCLLADIKNGKIEFDQLVADYFSEEPGKLTVSLFMKNVIEPFKNLVKDAFQLQDELENNLTENLNEQYGDRELTPEEKLKIVPFPIERSSNYLKDPTGICQTFILAKNVAIEMIERLNEEKSNQQIEDVIFMLHSVIISCIEQDFDLLNGLVTGLKYSTKGVRVLKHLMKELEEIVKDQIDHEKSK